MIARLWDKWLRYTLDVAANKAYTDWEIYGNAIIEKKWWGYCHVSYPNMYRLDK